MKLHNKTLINLDISKVGIWVHFLSTKSGVLGTFFG